MRILLYLLGVAAAIATLTFFTLSIWTGDGRWAGTAFVAVIGSACAFSSAQSFPPYVPHADRCNGC